MKYNLHYRRDKNREVSVKLIKYGCLLFFSLFNSANTAAQPVALGGPLLNIDFGDAAVYDLSVPGPPLQLGITDIPYTTDICPPPGSYTVVSGLSSTCYNDKWIPLLSDNTAFPDINGYMMLIHDIARQQPQTIFEYAMGGNCPGVKYQFSAAIINVDKPTSATGCTRFSSLTLQVEDDAGNVIASTTTGDIEFAVFSMGYHFTRYAVDFVIPTAAKGIVVKIIDEAKATAPGCSNGFAIDDIQVRVTGPDVGIGFDSTPAGEWVKSTCFQDNRSFTMHGSIEAGLANPAIQWQRSNDDGHTWMDIAGATGYTYIQHFNIPDTFLFRLQGSDASLIGFSNCGVFSNLLKVQVNGLPVNYTIKNNSPLCAGQDLIFDVSGGSSYTWSGPNNFFDNSPYAHIFHSKLADSGRYYVKIISPGGCSAVDSTDVVMLGVDINLSNDTTICLGNTIQLHASGGSNYKWSPGDGLSDASIPNPTAKPLMNTTYTVSVEDAAGCNNNGSVIVKIKNTKALVAKFELPGYVCKTYDSARFTDQSVGNIVQWHWNFDNGQVSSAAVPPVQYYIIGNNSKPYRIQLSVVDSAGCMDSISNQLKIADNCFVAVPAAFTPNNDGLNDYLYPLNAYKATHLFFKVYNRKGQLMFETNDWTKKWDGVFRGAPQDSGTYIWTLQYHDEQNKLISLKGTTVLLR